MVTPATIEQQLKRLGIKINFIGRAEVKELRQILVPGELIMQCLNGFYAGGGALLCATDQRLLLIDKKPWFLTMEDIPYDMVTEVQFFARLLNSTSHIHTYSKSLQFTSWHGPRLRMLTNYIQQRVMQLRSFGQPSTSATQLAGYHFQKDNYLARILMRPRIGKFTLKTIR
jgi:hypothetical protein